MAVDITKLEALFTRMGKMVMAGSVVDAIETGATNVVERIIDLIEEYSPEESGVTTLHGLLNQIRSSGASWQQTLANTMATAVNKELVDEEGLGTVRTTAQCLALLREYLGRFGGGVLENTVSIDDGGGGSVDYTATAQTSPFTNEGNANIYLSVGGIFQPITLDGTDAEVSRTWEAVEHPNAQLEEGVIPQDYLVLVSQDKNTGASSGAEILTVESQRPDTAVPYGGDWMKPGAVLTPVMYSSESGALNTNGGFEDFTGSGATLAFSNWTVSRGTPGTDFATSTGYRGDVSLQLLGGAGTAEPSLYQSMSNLNGRTKYLLHVAYLVHVKATGASARLHVELYDADGAWTPDATEVHSIDVGSGSGATLDTWYRVAVWFNTPDDLPTDLRLRVYLDGTSTDTANADVRVDEVLLLQPYQLTDGLYICPVAGSDDVLVGDRWSFTIDNDQAGKFQTFFSRMFGDPLPSVPTGTTDDGGAVVGLIAEPS